MCLLWENQGVVSAFKEYKINRKLNTNHLFLYRKRSEKKYKDIFMINDFIFMVMFCPSFDIFMPIDNLTVVRRIE